MKKRKQILRGILTSFNILFCYTVGITLYFSFPEEYFWYTIFAIISVGISLMIMFSNNHFINRWIWLGIAIGLPIAYYSYELIYSLFPALYEYFHPYLYYGSINHNANSLIMFVIQFFGIYLILLPLAYDIIKTNRKDSLPYYFYFDEEFDS